MGDVMKVVIIGGSYAGITAALTLRQKSKAIDIMILEKSSQIGFIPSTVSWILRHPGHSHEDFNWITVEDLVEQDISVRVNEEVISFDDHNVTTDARSYSFDRLIIATGSGQQSRLMTTTNDDRVMTVKGCHQVDKIIELLPQVTKVAVIGAGLVGLELADALADLGKIVHVYDHFSAILSRHFDPDVILPVEEALKKANVSFNLGKYVTEIIKSSANPDQLRLVLEHEDGDALGGQSSKGTQDFDLVVIAVNTRPDNAKWESLVHLNEDQTIWVDEHLRTSLPNVFAIGDAISVNFIPLDYPYYISLVNNAVRTAKVAALNCLSPSTEMVKDVGSARDVKTIMAGYEIASVGLTGAETIFYASDIETATISVTKRVKSSEQLTCRYFYDSVTHVLLGAQLISHDKFDYELAILTEAIATQRTIESLASKTMPYTSDYNYPISLFDLLVQTNKVAIKGQDDHEN
ncbi:MAG TPA: hypothetical protein DIW15_01590 [Bavariicoccus seileri]|uniref:FAD/NAD(P)-binding domain-containing protein n=2 Tax=Bavariicoccus seileri TaxID=549685 RepID=A0A3D4S424_9ENTE|nr:hypothetical protein [Bavariicoccus seileri]